MPTKLTDPGSNQPLEPSTAWYERFEALLRQLKNARAAFYPDAIAVKSGCRYQLVRVEDVDWIEADGNYTRLHAGKVERLLSQTLTVLEREVLDPAVFLRIHRSSVVNLSRVTAVEPLFHGELCVILQDGTRLTCSRGRRHKLHERIFFSR